jgi:hypothetical protein
MTISITMSAPSGRKKKIFTLSLWTARASSYIVCALFIYVDVDGKIVRLSVDRGAHWNGKKEYTCNSIR